jgi:hypothetical protein
MEIGAVDTNWARRLLLLFAGGVIAVLLGTALSIAFARPAGAATLALPGTSSLPLPVAPSTVVDSLTATVPTPVWNAVTAATALPTNVVDGVTATGSSPVTLPTGGLPISVPTLPVPALPLPQLPVVTKPTTQKLTDTLLSTGTAATPTPGIGGPAHASTGTAAHPSKGHESSAKRRTSGSGTPTTPGSPVRTPARPLPSSPGPLAPPNGDASVPGHTTSFGGALPLSILVLSLICLGGVFFRRHLPLKLRFDSRVAPPG